MGSVLLIGGAGFIGSHIAERLVKQVETVAVLDNFRRGRKAWVPTMTERIIERDVRYTLHREDIGCYDNVVNLACLWLKECEVNPEDGYETNVIGTLNSYLLARQMKARQFVQFSSASAYGDPLECTLPTKEGDERHPSTVYGRGKRDAEMYLTRMRFGPQLIILRSYNVYGRRQAENAAFTQVLPLWAKAVSEGKPIVVYGDGSQTMDMIHVTDVARFVTDYVLTGKANGIYNVASGVETSVLELAEACKRAWGVPGTTISLQPYPEACPRQQRRWADITRAKETGWTPEVKLEDGLADYWQWRNEEAKA